MPSGIAAAAEFQAGCELPFKAIAAADRDIDKACAAPGDAQPGPHAGQNVAKNNFCATGTPAVLTVAAFKLLQKKAEVLGIPFGSSNSLPKDRSALNSILQISGRKIGEGSVVQHVAFIGHAKNSNVSNGESVNCKHSGAEWNDIHIDLLQRTGDPACRGVTAEVTPHLRPEAWEKRYLDLITNRPVRITGQLFFDAAHRPCRSDQDAINPKRVSIWEIHPVYAIDVCKSKSISSCRARDKAKWIPLDRWINTVKEEDGNE